MCSHHITVIAFVFLSNSVALSDGSLCGCLFCWLALKLHFVRISLDFEFLTIFASFFLF